MNKKLVLAGMFCTLATTAVAQEENRKEEKWYQYDHLYFQFGTYFHYHHSDDHAGNNLFGSLEAQKSNHWLYGLALFDNSFGQFSQYLYGGYQWQLPGDYENFHFKLTAGVIHGYKEPWDDKIPFNSKNGWAPGLIPGIGYKKNGWGIDMIFLGNSALLFTLGKDFNFQ